MAPFPGHIAEVVRWRTSTSKLNARDYHKPATCVRGLDSRHRSTEGAGGPAGPRARQRGAAGGGLVGVTVIGNQ